MTLTQEQLEWVVQEVVRRLQQPAVNDHAKPTCDQARLKLSERLITLETLRGRLTGVNELEVPVRAIVTPAALDLVKDRQIDLIRG